MPSIIKNILRPPKKIGQILLENGVVTEEVLNANLAERHRRVGEVLIDNEVLNKDQVNSALAIQKKEKVRFAKNIAVLACALAIPSTLFTSNLNKPNDIIIRDAKIVTGVNKELVPLKVTNYFSKNTTKVCAWIGWTNAKINSQVLVKWYYSTDDVPIYDYNLNIPKREGVANVVLSMPEGKTLPSGTYKVTILLGKKHLTKPLVFEIE